MTDWVASGGGQAALMQSGHLRRLVPEAEAESGTGQTIVRVGDGVADMLPAPVLPDAPCVVPAWQQDSPPDVIGAWTRLRVAGFLALRGDWDGVVCVLEQDVSHWIHVSAKEAVSCQSFVTLRLMQVLGGGAVPSPEAIADSMARPERLAAHLRAAEVRHEPAALSGHLIGAELAAARPYWLGQEVAVIANQKNAEAWKCALQAQGVPCTCHDPGEMLAKGLAAFGKAVGLAD